MHNESILTWPNSAALGALCLTLDGVCPSFGIGLFAVDAKELDVEEGV